MRGPARIRVGVALGSGAVRAIGVQRDGIAWTLEAPLPAGEDRARKLTAFLMRIPARRWPGIRINVAIGPAHVQAKRLSGLPSVDDVSLLARVVAEGVGRFFLRNGIPLVTSGLRVDASGQVWGAAFERPLIDELAETCRIAGLTLGVVVPTVSVLPRALLGDTIRWSDEQIAVIVDSRAACMTGVRRIVADAPFDEPALVPAPGLAVLGSSAARFADAYGAALIDRNERLVLKPPRRAVDVTVPRWRLATAAAVLLTMVLLAVAAPALSSRRESARAATRLRELAAPHRTVAGTASELRRVSGVLDEVAAFGRTRRSLTLLLAAVTRVLPDGSALSMIRVDSATVMLVVFAPRAGAVLSALERLYQVTAPEIVGPVTKELVAAREVERATIRFRLRPQSISALPVPALAHQAVR